MKLTYTEKELPNIAQQIIEYAKPKSKTVLFKGEMGAGKTTLIKHLVKQLGVEDEVSSPTFSLVNEYTNGVETVYHFDFYRIDSEEEAYDIGFEEYLIEKNWCFIEWPEKIHNLIPVDALQICIKTIDADRRSLQISSF